MANIQNLNLEFGSLENSADESKIPVTKAWAMDSATTAKGILQGGPRWAQLSERSGANSADVALGFFYGEYKAAASYYVILKANGDTKAKLYSINPTSNVWTVSTTAVNLDASADWTFSQYEGNVYATNLNDGTFFFSVENGPDGDSDKKGAWKELGPEYHNIENPYVTTARPPYDSRSWAADSFTMSALPTPQNFTAQAKDSHLYIESVGPPSGTTAGTVDGSTSGYHYAKLSITIHTPANVDLTDVDFIGFTLLPSQADGCIVDPSLPEFPLMFGYSTNASATFSQCIPLPIKYSYSQDKDSLNNYGSLNSFFHEGGNTAPVYVWVDVRSLTATQKSTIRTFSLAFMAVYGDGHGFSAEITAMALGGSDILDNEVSKNPGGLDGQFTLYAYSYYNSTTKTETPATKVQIASNDMLGFRPATDLPRMGAWVNLLVDQTFLTGYDRVYFYRQVNGNWYRIADVANTDHVYIDKARSSTIKGTTYVLTFGELGASFKADCASFWKSHFCLGVDRKIYMSWAGRPNFYLPSPDEAFTAPDESDVSQGRTLYVSQNRSQEVVGLAPKDSLYLVSPYSVFAMSGDSALSATPPRQLPGSRGALGSRAVLPYAGGVLVGASDGLWYYEVARFAMGSNDGNYTQQELTESVRTSWAAMNSSNLVLVEEQDTIWAFNGTSYMRYTRPTPIDGQRRWESGTLTGLTVKAAIYWPTRGFRVLTTNGKFCEISTAYVKNGASTSDVNWSYTTGILDLGRSRVTQVKMQGSGTPTVQVVTWDGKRTSSPESVTFTKVDGQVTVLNANTQPGYRHQFVIGGVVGRDTVESVSLRMEEIGAGGGN